MYGSFAVLAVLAALMLQMLRLVRRRKQVKREWLERQAIESPIAPSRDDGDHQ